VSFWAVVLIAAGGAFAIEGAAWAIFPTQMKHMYETIFSQGERAIHISGLFSVAVGVVLIVWGVRASGLS